MTKTSETGHAKNVANFEELTNLVLSHSMRYNPTRSAIKVQDLQMLLTEAKTSLQNVTNALPPYRMAAAERETAFQIVPSLTTRLVNSLKATDTTSRMDETAQSLARKIKGERAKTIQPTTAEATATGAENKHISTAQTSFDSVLDNFDKLIKHLQNIPQFTPNEIELQPQSLNTLCETLRGKNNQVKITAIALDNARIARNKVLYQPITGLTDIAADVKTYIKSLFGATSPEYRQVSGIEIKPVK